MKKRILWMEDDYYAIRGLMRPLELEGFKIDVATSVSECYIKGQAWTVYDMIIVDLILPLSNDENIPVEITKWIDENMEYPGIGMVKWFIEEKKVDCPLLILSVVNDVFERFQLPKNKSIKILSKKGILPSKIKQEVLNIIGLNE